MGVEQQPLEPHVADRAQRAPSRYLQKGCRSALGQAQQNEGEEGRQQDATQQMDGQSVRKGLL